MKPSTYIHMPFIRGFLIGRRYGYISARQAQDAFPEYSFAQITVFLNGVDDGVRGEMFRVNLPIKAGR